MKSWTYAKLIILWTVCSILFLASNIILITKSGNCSYVKKAVNAQKVGARSLIIIDNITLHKKVIPSNDGSGRQVHIPTLFISEDDGN